jgi:hypothetical protein
MQSLLFDRVIRSKLQPHGFVQLFNPSWNERCSQPRVFMIHKHFAKFYFKSDI